MISIYKAALSDAQIIVDIGKISVGDAHRESSSAEDMNQYLEANYNVETIVAELRDPANNYYLLNYNGQPAGFSKIILNAAHPNIAQTNAAKLDRIYLLKEYFGLKLGFELLRFNIEFAKESNQSGIWLFTWTGNHRAVDFYHKAGFRIIGTHNFYITEKHYNPNHQMFLDIL
jgi:diamine N-acetyltransferase